MNDIKNNKIMKTKKLGIFLCALLMSCASFAEERPNINMRFKKYLNSLVAIIVLLVSACVIAQKKPDRLRTTAREAGKSKPNIIFILSDDISPKEYALYGGDIHTPTLEKMGNEGLYFKTAYATPRCIPTRAMLLTGTYPVNNLVFENQVYPRGADGRIESVGKRFPNNLGHLMTQNGYRTAFIGKHQTGTPKEHGFTNWNTLNHGSNHRYFDMMVIDNNVDGIDVQKKGVYSTDFNFDYLHEFTREKSEDPWFVFMPLNLPHWVRNRETNKFEPPIVPVLDQNFKPTGATVKGDFKACVRYIDYKMSLFVAHLEKTGQLENTIIMYAGDNGTSGYGKSNPAVERGPQVPFVVYAPGYLKPTGASDVLVDFTDVLPTCVELAGGELPMEDSFDGTSFAPLIIGEEFKGREWIASQWYGCRWLRTERWLIDGKGHFYDCGDNRNDWVKGVYKDVTMSENKEVIATRKSLEKIMKTMPQPDYNDPELKKQWTKTWTKSKKFVEPYIPPYLNE